MSVSCCNVSWVGPLTLSAVLDLKRSLLALASCRLVAAGSLDAVDSVDTALGSALGILEQQPLNRAFGLGTRAGRGGRISFVQLGKHGNGVRRL